MHYSEADGKFTIGERQGDFPGMLQQRVFKVVKVSKDHPVAFNEDVAAKTVEYKGDTVELAL